MESLLAFAGIAVLLTVSPGPDMAVMLRNVLRGGTTAVLPTALGTVTGLGAWALASAIGLSALLASSASAYAAFRLAGAGYLALLGIAALRHALGPASGTDPGRSPAGQAVPIQGGGGGPVEPDGGLPPRAAYRTGLLTNLTNPKVGVVYATLLPQFIPPGAPVLGASLLLAGIHAGFGLAWLTFYGRALHRLAGGLAAGWRPRAVGVLTGLALLALAATVAAGA